MNKQYLVYFEYFATGEGHTIEISMIIATNEEEAKHKYFNTAFASDVNAQSYFEKDISVVELDSERGKEIIFTLFKEADSLYETLKLGGREFHYKMYYNLS
jgi:hypothetical protein